ncbi:SDR family oxidoreductase [Maribius pontilimi]|uniref:SDR family oxidoreductase n=1 Tax=Palleronia pontilimi TaxID=1964209 RepID=A0A934MHP3_9RHOB|nr:SDR family oxidoreductase [Palleronia pontilimi]MBJ3763489.1 SDR family oxidoreductase [Palleronia pontilimi]
MPHLLITGGAKRMGAAVARHFAARGWQVTVNYRSSADAAQALADELNATRPCCAIVQGDLARRTGIDATFDGAVAAFGPVDLLLNNASTFNNDDIFGLDDATFDDHLAVNLKAPIYLSERMAAQGGDGDRLIVNMLDNKLFALNPDFFSYTISKAALLSATHMMALRFDGRPRVCGIAPSVTLISGKQSQENFEKSARINPLGRRVFPEDIADCVQFMWDEKGQNGQVTALDGGQTLLALPRDVAFLVKEGRIDEEL